MSGEVPNRWINPLLASVFTSATTEEKEVSFLMDESVFQLLGPDSKIR